MGNMTITSDLNLEINVSHNHNNLDVFSPNSSENHDTAEPTRAGEIGLNIEDSFSQDKEADTDEIFQSPECQKKEDARLDEDYKEEALFALQTTDSGLTPDPDRFLNGDITPW